MMRPILTTRRPVSSSRIAMFAFAVVYLATLAIVLAPKGSFGAAHPETFVQIRVSP